MWSEPNAVMLFFYTLSELIVGDMFSNLTSDLYRLLHLVLSYIRYNINSGTLNIVVPYVMGWQFAVVFK